MSPPRITPILAIDLLLEHGPPWNEAEAESVIDHREPAAGELGRSDELAAHRLPFVDGLESKAAVGRQLPADALHLLACQGADEVGFDLQPALGRPTGVPLPDQLMLAPLERLPRLGAEPTGGERAALAADELVVEPGGAIAAYLADELEHFAGRGLLLQRFGEFAFVFFELLFQIGTRLALPTNVHSHLRSCRTKTTNAALRPLTRQGHLVGTVTSPVLAGPSRGSSLSILTEPHDELAPLCMTRKEHCER
jgi:hypothetical protein